MKWKRLITKGLSDLTEERSGHSATLCGHYVFVIGGGQDGVEDYYFPDAVLNLKTRKWANLGTNTTATFHTTCLVDDKLFCVGGKWAMHDVIMRRGVRYAIELRVGLSVMRRTCSMRFINV